MASRKFAPLKEASAASSGLPKLKGIVFDVDGTLCEPQNYMFGEMRSVLGITKAEDILDHIYGLPTEEAREEAMESVRVIERRAMASQRPQPGLAELMAYLDERGVRKGICTRNFDQPVQHLLGKFLPDSMFGPIVTREFRPPKPDPAGILFIARSWGLVRTLDAKEAEDAAERAVGDVRQAEREGALGSVDAQGLEEIGDGTGLIMVGDSIDDMTAGRRAGATTVLLVNEVNEHLADHAHTDMIIDRLDDLIQVLEEGFVGREIHADE